MGFCNSSFFEAQICPSVFSRYKCSAYNLPHTFTVSFEPFQVLQVNNSLHIKSFIGIQYLFITVIVPYNKSLLKQLLLVHVQRLQAAVVILLCHKQDSPGFIISNTPLLICIHMSFYTTSANTLIHQHSTSFFYLQIHFFTSQWHDFAYMLTNVDQHSHTYCMKRGKEEMMGNNGGIDFSIGCVKVQCYLTNENGKDLWSFFLNITIPFNIGSKTLVTY